MAEFRARMAELYRRVVGVEKMSGVDRVWFPGEMEQVRARERRKAGIPYAAEEIKALNAEAARVGLKGIEIADEAPR